MKKVMSVNIGGLVFQIDNEAYAKLEGYIAALEKQFRGTEGSEEIISDIESRIAEIFQEKVKAGKESIGSVDIEEIIRIMGAPKDLEEEKEASAQDAAERAPSPSGASPAAGVPLGENAAPETESVDPAAGDSSKGRRKGKREAEPAGEPGHKRFFRNADDKILGGVCSGFATYIDADPLVVRLAFLLAVLGFGMGPVLYFILWIIVPEAKTTSEKLQMRGEKVTIDSIEKSIRKEAKDLKRRFENIKEEIEHNPEHPVNKYEKKGRDFFVKAGDSIAKMIVGIVKLFIGLVVSIILISIFTAIFGITGGLGFANFVIPGFAGLMFSTASQANMALIGLLAVIGIPIIIAAYKGLSFLMGNRGRTKALDFVFLLSWAVGLGLMIVTGAMVAREFECEVSYREELPLQINPVQTIYLNKLESPDRYYRHGKKVNMDGLVIGNDSVFFKDLKVDIEPAGGNQYSLISERYARGRDRDHAIENAKSIQYHFRESDTSIELSQEFSIADKTWRRQELSLILEIPIGKRIVIDERMQGMIRNVSTREAMERDELFNRPLQMSPTGLEPYEEVRN